MYVFKKGFKDPSTVRREFHFSMDKSMDAGISPQTTGNYNDVKKNLMAGEGRVGPLIEGSPPS